MLIYFSRDEVVRLLDRIADWLPPDGWLFLGYSESLWQVTERFQLVRLGDAFVYRRRESPVRARARRPGPPLPTAKPRASRPVPDDAPRIRAGTAPRSPKTTNRLDVLLAEGESAVDAGDHATAVTVFRKCTYLAPDQPITHLHLGLALEESGDIAAAQRAYTASRAALDACDTASIEAVLEGYQVEELARLLERKLVKAR